MMGDVLPAHEDVPLFPACPYEGLREIDWTFPSAQTRGDTHGIHSYPAKFIPQIPRALIAALHPGDDTAVLDPFCGSGTALVEAALSGIPAIGVDVNPLACLISRVKVTPLRRSLVTAAEIVSAAAMKRPRAIPPIPALDHWFQHDVQLAISSLIYEIDSTIDDSLREALRVALSRIIVRVSNQESDTRYAAIKKVVTGADVYRHFMRSAQAIDEALATAWPGLLAAAPKVSILNEDILKVRPRDIGARVSLVITSPPYPNAYEYWLYHKYRMYWLGMDPLAVKAAEIGARPHYFKKQPHTPADFQRQMDHVFGLLSDVLVSGGHACFQVGSSLIRGQEIDNAAIIKRAATSQRFSLVASMARAIPLCRKAFNPRHSRIREENVLVFRLGTK